MKKNFFLFLGREDIGLGNIYMYVMGGGGGNVMKSYENNIEIDIPR